MGLKTKKTYGGIAEKYLTNTLRILNNFTLDGINLVPSQFQCHYYPGLNRTMFKLILLKFQTHRIIFFNNYVATIMLTFFFIVYSFHKRIM